MAAGVLDLRLYRAAFVPAVLALLIAAFSLDDRPRPIATTLAPNAFDPQRAMRTLDELAERHPSRRPGSSGDLALAGDVEDAFRAAFTRRAPDGSQRLVARVTGSDGRARTVDGARTLRTVVAERPGREGRRIVVLAFRDALRAPGEAELSSTAALVELARVFGGRATRRTLTLVSTSGGSGGAAGARLWAREARGPTDAVIVLGAPGSTDVRKPWVVPWSTARGQASQRLTRTVELAVRRTVGQSAGGARAWSQWLRLAFPLTVSAQGPLLEDGLPAVLLSPAGELGPRAGAEADEATLGRFGRATLRAVSALDNGPDVPPGGAFVVTRDQVLEPWVVRLLVGALLLPALLAALDGFFRARRRGAAPGRWVAWAACGAIPLLGASAFVLALRALGAIPAPKVPVPPGAVPVAWLALVGVAAVLVVGWFVARLWAVRRVSPIGRPGELGAGAGVALLVQAAIALVWARNPHAAFLLVPAAHLWLLAAAPQTARARALAFAVAGFVPVVVALVLLGAGLDAGPVDLAWLSTLAVAGGYVGWVGLLVGSLLVGAGLSLCVVAWRRSPREDATPVGRDGRPSLRTRGPASYAGPGSLGGTDSALRR